MKRNISTILAIALGTALLMSLTATAQTCSLARAAATYAFSDSGTIIGVGPRVAVGVLTLDAAGNLLNGKATSSLNGAIAQEAFSGTYSVSSDCRGTFAIDVRDLSGNLLLTISGGLAWDDNMKEIRLIFTSAALADGTPLSIIISGEGRKLVP